MIMTYKIKILLEIINSSIQDSKIKNLEIQSMMIFLMMKISMMIKLLIKIISHNLSIQKNLQLQKEYYYNL